MSGINFGIGDPGDAESVDGSGGVIALLKRLRTLLGGTITVTGPLDVEVNGSIGQQVMAASLPVAMASDQDGIATVSDQDTLAAAAANVHEPAANTAAVITYAAGGAGVGHVISGVAWSYDVAPTAGSLTIEDGVGTTVFVVSITAAGPGFFGFSPRLRGTANTALVITLAAAGAAVTGKVSILGHWTV